MDDFDLQTSNQLFPLGHACLGYIDAVGRQNIIDYRARLAAWPIPKKLRIQADLHVFRLGSDDDALYNAGGGVVRPSVITTAGGRMRDIDEKAVGEELDLTLLWNVNPRISSLFGYSHFWAGDFIKATGTDDDVDFAYLQLSLKF
jgi:hypothetical protein